jgi:hypothetical protein
MTDEDLLRLIRSEGKDSTSPIIKQLANRLADAIDRVEELEGQITPCGIDIASDSLAKPPIICNTCGAKV